MNLLFLGDVVGDMGCDILEKKMYSLKQKYKIDLVVVNGENSATGNGLTRYSYQRLVSVGADVITTGNHCFKRKEALPLYDENDTLLRPANFPKGVPGHGYTTLDLGYCQIAVVNLMGTTYMEPLDNPFFCIDSVLDEIDARNIMVDIHSEATSEKKAMGFYLDGRVTAVIGTHTHVQTADEMILPKGTAYITDAGMTGPELSVLGVKSELAIEKIKYHAPVKFEESENPCFINGVVIDFDENSGKANKIIRIIER
ncbi:TIGR00282 family metallophosphoesterase [Ruminococcus sp. NK3A76]|uniref:TIGR00282 family metallophosphoesterase n=1 Tax=Ruminococcus sp. NK3A76 TaxID=877411 RepID=UPI00048C327A|nr:TIGR00282 family metallophosphoesterase [Ruminococcus sp. NK3A76]